MTKVPSTLKGAGLSLSQSNEWGKFYDKMKAAGADDATAAAQAWSIIKRIYRKSKGTWVRSRPKTESPGYYIKPPPKDLGESHMNKIPSPRDSVRHPKTREAKTESGHLTSEVLTRYKRLHETQQGEPYDDSVQHRLVVAANRLQTIATTGVVMDVQDSIDILRNAEYALREISIAPLGPDGQEMTVDSAQSYPTQFGILPRGINPWTLSQLAQDIRAENSDYVLVPRARGDQLSMIADALRNFARLTGKPSIQQESHARDVFRAKLAEAKSETCPECGSKVPPGSKKCADCGTKMSEAADAKCADCGAKLAPGAKKCIKCGAMAEAKKPAEGSPDEEAGETPDEEDAEVAQAKKKGAKTEACGGKKKKVAKVEAAHSCDGTCDKRETCLQPASACEGCSDKVVTPKKKGAKTEGCDGGCSSCSKNKSKKPAFMAQAKEVFARHLGEAEAKIKGNLCSGGGSPGFHACGKGGSSSAPAKRGGSEMKLGRGWFSKAATAADKKAVTAQQRKVFGKRGESATPKAQVLERLFDDVVERSRALRGKMIRYGAPPAMSSGG